ncbi:cellulose-binding domain-containing protein [Streptomyces sp. SID13726]|uniref:cellulose-binding domain-containing protein n=1 Tax=Streptomyces sp. SID13726 TaxID=2706058 RepID=UPI0013BE4697|nr:cellulose-binding domain-containing protein [Streptomyces sp. SID13726]NEA97976.1 cellulose-binding protein [Streptomyces sp. SID13726]
MPDLPTPQNAAEAALFSECWDAVLSYADLCTAGSAAATELATEAFSLGMREARDAEAAVRGAGRRSVRLPRIPLLLTAVRTTAADWEIRGLGHRLDPELRLWLNSDKASRYTGPPLQRPIALRGLRDLQAADAELLWLAEVEALPMPVVARRLGLDPATLSDELAQVRGLFRDRSHRNHLDSPMDAQCRSYARLLDAVTRSTSGETPDDLSRHLARCVQCAEAAACLRLHGGGLPAALAGGVIGWGGLAYLERRRRAAEVRLGAGRPAALESGPSDPGAHKAKVVRNGLLVAAVLVSLLALAVSMMPGADMEDGAAKPGNTTEGQPVANPTSAAPSATSRPPSAEKPQRSGASGAGGTSAVADPSAPANSDPEPQGTSSGGAEEPEPSESAAPQCTARYDLVNQWPDGFQAAVTVTTTEALADWRVTWSFKDGQKVTQMWDANYTQSGGRVSATAADYNKSVPADGSLTLGFLATWQGKNAPAYDFSLNGHSCTDA